MVRNMICFYAEELLAPRPNPKLEDHPSAAVRYCLFNLFAATLLIGGRSSIRNPRMRHAVVTGTHYMEGNKSYQVKSLARMGGKNLIKTAGNRGQYLPPVTPQF